MLAGAAGERECQRGIVELRIPVRHATCPRGENPWHHRTQGCRPQPLTGCNAQPARKPVVESQAHPQTQPVEPPTRRHHKAQRAYQGRRVAQQMTALTKGLAHERKPALRKVAHAAMDQLGRARTGPRGKVTRFDQQHRIPARRGIERATEASGTAADDKHVP